MKLLVAFLCFCVGLVAHAAASPDGEIEGLLAYVKQLDGAAFLRNGSEHTPATAEAHLRTKWDRQKEQIKTAEDFIERCATRSSMSGARYQIRFKDGAVRDSAEVLREQLAKLRTTAAH